MKSKSGFSGVYPMVFALFNAKGELSREAMRRQIAALLASKVHGISILGLATEVNKLSNAERRTLMEWVAEDVGGAIPIAVTIAEPSVQGQVEFVKAAAGVGAKWVILQPPPVKSVPESALIQFFGTVADASPIPVGIQNAPEYLGIGLSNAGISTLHKQHPNFKIVKLEATALAIGRLIDQVEGTLDVFNGRDGIEMLDSMRAGAVGVVPGAEVADLLARIFDLFDAGSAESIKQAERRYQEILPLLIVLMESIDTFLVYGKQVLGHRLGMSEIDARAPAAPATAFGLEMARRYATAAGLF